MNYARVPSIRHLKEISKNREFRQSLAKRLASRALLLRAKERRERRLKRKRLVKKFLKVLAFLLLAGLFALILSSCSTAKKVEICEKWANENPEAFYSPPDTVYTLRTAPADTIRDSIFLSQIEGKPLRLKGLRGEILELKVKGPKLALSAFYPEKVDTLKREVRLPAKKIDARPAQLKERYKEGLTHGAGAGAALILLIVFILSKIFRQST